MDHNYKLVKFALNFTCTAEHHWDSKLSMHSVCVGKHKFTNSVAPVAGLFLVNWN